MRTSFWSKIVFLGLLKCRFCSSFSSWGSLENFSASSKRHFYNKIVFWGVFFFVFFGLVFFLGGEEGCSFHSRFFLVWWETKKAIASYFTGFLAFSLPNPLPSNVFGAFFRFFFFLLLLLCLLFLFFLSLFCSSLNLSSFFFILLAFVFINTLVPLLFGILFLVFELDYFQSLLQTSFLSLSISSWFPVCFFYYWACFLFLLFWKRTLVCLS